MAHVAQMVERVLGKDEVTSSILVVGSLSVGRRDVGRRFDAEKCVGGPEGGRKVAEGDVLKRSRRWARRFKKLGGSNSVARVTAFQAVGRGFESRLPLLLILLSTLETKPEKRIHGEREI